MPDKEQRWWDECYVANPLIDRSPDAPPWRVLYGVRGSGKSTALAALGRTADSALILDYSPKQLPGSRQSLHSGNNLSQIMALASLDLRRRLSASSWNIEGLSELSRSFLRWLIQKFGGERGYLVWLASLPADAAAQMSAIPFQDLYATDTQPEHVHGQIKELVLLAQQLGLAQILVVMDVEINLTDAQVKGLRELLTWLDLMQHDKFRFVVAMPGELVERIGLFAATRARMNLTRLDWTPAECRKIADWHVRAATDGQVSGIGALAEPAVIQELEHIIEREFGQPVPRGAVDLAHLILDFATKTATPLKRQHLTDLVQKYFAEYMRLHLETHTRRRGVWRGPRFIELDEQTYKLLSFLAQRTGRATPPLDHDLIALATSKSNVQMLVHRLRVKIEPDIKAPTYLKSRRNDGYWLENITTGDGM